MNIRCGGLFLATPPIAGLKQEAVSEHRDAETDKNLTSDKFAKAHVHALQAPELVFQLQSSPHENMLVNGHDDLASLKVLYEKCLPYRFVHYEHEVKPDIHSKPYDAQNDVMLFPDFHACKMLPPHSINFGI